MKVYTKSSRNALISNQIREIWVSTTLTHFKNTGIYTPRAIFSNISTTDNHLNLVKWHIVDNVSFLGDQWGNIFLMNEGRKIWKNKIAPFYLVMWSILNRILFLRPPNVNLNVYQTFYFVNGTFLDVWEFTYIINMSDILSVNYKEWYIHALRKPI